MKHSTLFLAAQLLCTVPPGIVYELPHEPEYHAAAQYLERVGALSYDRATSTVTRTGRAYQVKEG